jgi:GntR family transcriptional regulator
VLKGYQQLVDEQLVEKRRGRGMYVSPGAAPRCAPRSGAASSIPIGPGMRAHRSRLGLSVEELLQRAGARCRASCAADAPNKDENDGHDH